MSVRGANRRVWLLASLCAFGLPGCAQITVVTDEQPPKSELRFGVLAIDLAPAKKNTIVSASGLGLISNPSGATLGYSAARIVRLGDECRLVIQTPDARDAAHNEELVRLLKSIPHACGT